MALTERKARPEKVLKLVTDIDDASITSRKRLKGVFLEKDKQQMKSYIQDLEKTILLNKGIISDLLSNEASNAVYKNTIKKLNRENSELQGKVKELIRERDSVQARLLVCEQMAEELKGREADLEQHYADKSREMLEQLSIKEYVVQSFERRLRKAVILLQKYKEHDVNIRFLLRELAEDGSKKKSMKNVVEENEILLKIMKEIYAKIEHFEQELHCLAHGKSSEFLLSDSPQVRLNEKSVSAKRELNKVETYAKAINDLLVKLKKDKLAIEHNFMKTREENRNVSSLNTRLSKKLDRASEELRLAKRKDRVAHVVKKETKRCRRSSVTEERTELNDEQNFGDMSSIIEDCRENEFFSFFQDINEES
eukprot:TRINITY_DN1795_c0_g9_i1.p1 TRINITY_DN1795_c0_g9~~TRINITY_DN1795_c0_g9_i1.p1  ORF type:complete len:367 (+),score=121.19 TRINITY_DN1795_c0_g9_i1:200-1300(+)